MANSPLLQIPLLSTSQAAKETTINTMVSYLERAMNDAKTINFAGADFVIPPLDLARYFSFALTATGATSVLHITATKRLFCLNNTSSGNDVTLNCTSDTLTITAGAIVVVYCDGTNLFSVADSLVTGGGGGGSTNLLGLSDTPNSYAAQQKLVLRVKTDESGIEFYALKLSDLADANTTGISDGDVMVWDTTTSKFIPVALPTSGGAEDTGIVVTCATTAAITILDELVVGGTIDNHVLAVDDTVLVKNNSTQSSHGIYIVTLTDPERVSYMPSHGGIAQGLEVLVLDGTINGGTIWYQVEELASADDTPINFALVASRIDASSDFDSSVTLINGMVMVYDSANQRWKPQVTSTTLPSGGTTGQALVKHSGTDFDFEFKTLVPAGGSTGQALVKASGTDLDTTWGTVLKTPTVRTVTATTDTPVLADAYNSIVGDNAGTITFTIPTNASVPYVIGTTLTLIQNGAGKCAVVGDTGVTVNKPATFLANSAEQYATIALNKIATNVWVLTGYLEVA